MGKEWKTNFLFSEPGFIIGAGSAMNLPGNYYHFNEAGNGRLADTYALKSDWYITGYDILGASKNIKHFKS